MFSIITPTWNRWDGKLQRCLESVRKQTFRDYEHIIVNTASTDGTAHHVAGYSNIDPRVKLINQKENFERVNARNAGMDACRGEWIVWLDSDDAIDSMYLAAFDAAIQSRPNARVWLCGAVVHGMREGIPVWTKLRQVWMPPEVDGEYPHFPSGHIGTGMFVYHRSAMKKIGPMPPWMTLCELADGVDEWLGYETGYSCAKKWVGNPWGDDWAYLRKLTLDYKLYPLNESEPANSPCLYIHYVR
jgi:glycosyltransferase involved in cell wall biosynthesis